MQTSDELAARAPKARVLVVEDDAIVGADIRVTLTRLGYGVIGPLGVATDALTAVPQHKPDLVMMDIQTRGDLDGIEVAQMLRAEMRVPVIFLTAHSDADTIKRAGAADPLGYVVKPFKAADLASVIEVALHRHRVENAMVERDRALAALSARLVAAIESLDGAVMIEDESGMIQHMNQQLVALLAECGVADPATIRQRAQVFAALGKLLKNPEQRWVGSEPPRPSGTSVARHGELLELRDGRSLELHAAPTLVSGEYGGCLWTLRDVTEREQTKQALRELSLIDALTGLHNRRGLLTRAELLQRTAVREGNDLAILFIDLDGMKAVNDEHGHEMGDQLLQRTAAVLRSTFRSGDVLARLGGDEFVVVTVVAQHGERALVARLAQRCESHNAARPELPPIRMSIGVAVSQPDRAEPIEDLLNRADAEMYAQKRARRAQR